MTPNSFTSVAQVAGEIVDMITVAIARKYTLPPAELDLTLADARREIELGLNEFEDWVLRSVSE